MEFLNFRKMKKFLCFFAGAGILGIVLSGCGTGKNAQTVQTQQVSSEETVAVTFTPPSYRSASSQSAVAPVYNPASSEIYAPPASQEYQSPATVKNTAAENTGNTAPKSFDSSSDSESHTYYVSMTIQPLYEAAYVQSNTYPAPSNGRLFHNLTPPPCLNPDIYTPPSPCPGSLFHGLYYN
jgi:hypothetical protein